MKALVQLFPGLLLVLVLAAGLLLSARAPKIWVWPQEGDVRSGHWQQQFAKNYDLHLPLRDPGIETWGVAAYLLGEGRPGVQIGRSGWLYTDEEFRTAPNDDAVISAKLEYIGQVSERLRAQGTRLLVALIPAKARVYPEYLGSKRIPAVKADDYQSFRSSLARQGTVTPDLWSALQAGKAVGEVFLHADTHWTPLGARAAAHALERVAAQSFPHLIEADASFLTIRQTPIRYFGDLLAYVRLGPLQRSWGPSRDLLAVESTTRVSPDRAGTAQVLLIGTSYSANSSWNFQGALEQEFGTELRNASAEGRGPLVPMQAYLDTLPERTPPRLLIWELPERFLDTPPSPVSRRVLGAS